jgi:hypothetical protein
MRVNVPVWWSSTLSAASRASLAGATPSTKTTSARFSARAETASNARISTLAATTRDGSTQSRCDVPVLARTPADLPRPAFAEHDVHRACKMPNSRISKRRVLRAPNSSRLSSPRRNRPCGRSDPEIEECGGCRASPDRSRLRSVGSDTLVAVSRSRGVTSSCRGRERDTRTFHVGFPLRGCAAVGWRLGQRRSDEPSFTTTRLREARDPRLPSGDHLSRVPSLARSRGVRAPPERCRGYRGDARRSLPDRRVSALVRSSFNRALEHASRPCIPVDLKEVVFHLLRGVRDRSRDRARLSPGWRSQVMAVSVGWLVSFGTANRSSGLASRRPSRRASRGGFTEFPYGA